MEKTTICHACGRTMDGAFRYCPWCGQAACEANGMSEQMDRVFDRLEELQHDGACARFDKMEIALGCLERELSQMVAVSHPA